MPHRLVPVPVRVRLCDWSVVVVLMMLVMDVTMFMLKRAMFMLMLVTLGEVRPQPETHQSGREEQNEGQRLTQQQEG